MSRTFKTLAVAVPVTVLLLAIAVPNFVKSRSVISMNACANNLRCIEGAKKEWVVQHNATIATPTEADLLSFLPGRPATLFPACPSGGKYTIGPAGEPPKCSIGGVGHTVPAD